VIFKYVRLSVSQLRAGTLAVVVVVVIVAVPRALARLKAVTGQTKATAAPTIHKG